jgi:hypothetical protein
VAPKGLSKVSSFDRARWDAIVLHRNANAHRFFAAILLGNFRSETGDTTDDKNQLSERRREAEIVENSSQSAIDIDRERLEFLLCGDLDGFHERNAITGQTAIARNPEKNSSARIARVDPVP